VEEFVSRRKLIAANWKMQSTLRGAKAFAERLKSRVAADPGFDMMIFPPFLSLAVTAEILEGTPVAVGAQDLFWEKTGAYTGEISGEMVVEAGGSAVLVGHSERRHVIGETNEVVGKKLKAALDAGLVPVFCVGETIEQRETGRAEPVVEGQMETAIAGLSLREVEKIVVAYEPVWAIGTGRTATPQDAVAMHRFIRRYVGERFGAPTSDGLRILYGGSVKPENAGALLREAEIDGALVGGASLDVDSFLRIANAAGSIISKPPGA
jgi:triosephosphate isomerase